MHATSRKRRLWRVIVVRIAKGPPPGWERAAGKRAATERGRDRRQVQYLDAP